MDSEVTFMTERQDPPARKPGARGVWKERLEPLLDDPGHWYKVAEGPWRSIERMRYSLASGRYEAPEGKWKFRMVSGEERKTGELFAQYVGPTHE